MLTKFLIRPGVRSSRIEPVDVLRETATSVFLPASGWPAGERREGKLTTYSEYHDTWEQAREALLKSAQQGVVTAQRQLGYANDFLGNVRGLRKPDVPPLPVTEGEKP